AVRLPERTLVSVKAQTTWFEPPRPLAAPTRTAQHDADDVHDIADLQGRHSIPTRFAGRVTIAEHHATAAIEVMSRWSVDPRWLITLPPTMSPVESTQRDGLLEHPDEAFAYFRDHCVIEVVCETKHMGSRALVVVCRDESVSTDRFGVR